VEYVRQKITDRYPNSAHAFHFFDQRCLRKLHKIDFTHGLDQLGVRLAKDDLEKVWKHLDQDKKGTLSFKNFCSLNDLNSNSLSDPFTLRFL